MAQFKQQHNSTFVHLGYLDTEQRLLVRVDKEIPILHECSETNTFIIDHSQMSKDDYFEIRSDLIEIDNTLVPYGQFGFFIYVGEGEFYLWGQSYEANIGKMAAAFESFGYTPVTVSPVQIHVSDKDLFKLKLRFGS